MNRRGFLKGLAGAAAIAATPGMLEALEPKRTIFLPPKGGWNWSRLDRWRLEYEGNFYAEQLAKSMQQTKETLVANILNQSFSNRLISTAEFSRMIHADLVATFNEAYL